VSSARPSPLRYTPPVTQLRCLAAVRHFILTTGLLRTRYWNVYPRKHAPGLWIAVSDVHAGNGTMSVLPRLHRQGTLPRHVDAAKQAANATSGKPVFSDTIDPRAIPQSAEAVEYSLPAGSIALHDTMTPHRALPNTSTDEWRHGEWGVSL
jgi:ectoine hydroxylase-related dioxygenase (phytanoyl-CoA dioxygenase family)